MKIFSTLYGVKYKATQTVTAEFCYSSMGSLCYQGRYVLELPCQKKWCFFSFGGSLCYSIMTLQETFSPGRMYFSDNKELNPGLA